MTRPNRFSQTDITRAVKAVEKVGLCVSRVRIEPDGAITQITWITSASGEARTRASRNREEADVARTFAEKRQDEQLAAFFGKNNAAREKDKGKFGE